MKGSNSRQNFDAKNRFSNLYQVQGGMITDADQDEKALISQARDEIISQSTIGTGIPDVGGMVTYANGAPSITEGLVYAGGKSGQFALSEPAGSKPKIAEVWTRQADFPDAAPLTEGPQLIYADVWEQTVFAGQDVSITDPGLHGTETSYRTKTMVQLKALPLEDLDFTTVQDLMKNDARFATNGSAKLRISASESDVQVNGCDPCADQIIVDETLPNMLWRLEIVNVERKNNDEPKSVQIAWSAENGSVIDQNTAPARSGIARDQAVYQYFSDRIDAHQGWHPSSFQHHRSAFSADIEMIPVSVTKTPFTHVRRWDGTAAVTLGSGKITQSLGGESAKFDTGTLTIQTRFFSAALEIGTEDLMIGDYWLVEVRRFAHASNQLRLIGANSTGAARAIGVKHTHCPLLLVDGGESITPPQALRQLTSAPTLGTIQAHDAGYKPPANCPVFGDAHNVQDALDALCGLQALNVGIAPPEDCETLSNVDNLQDALEALCAADNERNLRVMLRTMMDWGVVCGLRLLPHSNKPDVIEYSSGTALDRLGLLREFNSNTLSLNEIKPDNIHGDLERIQSRAGEVCLSMELQEEGAPIFHLSDASYPYVPSDMTLKERIADCLKDRERIDDSELLQKLGEKEYLVLNKIMTAWTNRYAVGRALEVSEEDLQIGLNIFKELMAEFLSRSTGATEARLKTLLADVEKELSELLEKAGDNTGNIRLRYLVAQFGILARVESETRADCTCEAALPGCTVHPSSKPVLIPIGCVELSAFTPGKLAMTEVCDMCCRKLANTWQNYRYFYGDQMRSNVEEYEGLCCTNFASAGDLDDFLRGWEPSNEDLDPAFGSAFWPPDPGISNQGGRNGPDVRGFTIESARELLKKTGVQLEEEFVIERSPKLFEELMERLEKPVDKPLGLVFEARKDDVVGLIHEKGTVVDLFVVKASPIYGYNKPTRQDVFEAEEGGEVILSDGSKLDLSRNPGIQGIWTELDDLRGNGGGGDDTTVSGRDLDIDLNPSIRTLRDDVGQLTRDFDNLEFPESGPAFDLNADKDFDNLRNAVTEQSGRLTGLQDAVDAVQISGAQIDITGNKSITGLQTALANAGSGSGEVDGKLIPIRDNPAVAGLWDIVDTLPRNADDFDLSKNELIARMLGDISGLTTGDVSGASLDLSENQRILDLQIDIDNSDNEIAKLSDRIPSLTGIENRIGVLEGQGTPSLAAVEGRLNTLEDVDPLVASDIDPLEARLNALENAAPPENSGLTMSQVLANNTISKLREDVTDLKRDRTTQGQVIDALLVELKDCKTMIRRNTPIEDQVTNNEISRPLKEAGFNTVGQIIDAGQDNIQKILSKSQTTALFNALNTFLNPPDEGK